MGAHSIDLAVPPAAALAAVGEAAELWGAAWEPLGSGGELYLPVVRGLRRGLLRGRISVARSGRGSSLSFEVEESHHALNKPAVVVLMLGALGGLAAALWPFYPPLLAVVPTATLLAVVAWLLVASRLRHSGPEDFLELVASIPEAPAGPTEH